MNKTEKRLSVDSLFCLKSVSEECNLVAENLGDEINPPED